MSGEILNMNLTDFNELPPVSVIIPAYNEEKRIANAIEAVLKQTYPKDKMEIIVVDDGSMDKTCEIVSRYPVKLIRHHKNKGPSAARNTGAKNAGGEILAFTDADDKADKSWLTNIVKHYKKRDVGCVVGSSHITCNNRNWQQRILAELFICLRGDDVVKNVCNSKGQMGSNKSIGTNITFRKDVFKEMKGYDKNLRAGEEQNLVWMIEKAGYKIAFEPSSIVYIAPKDNFKKYIKLAQIYSKNSVIVYFEYPAKITLRYLFNIFYLPLIIAMLIFGVLFNIGLFIYPAMMVLVLPIGYYLIRIFKGRRYIKKPVDVIFIFIIGYIGFILASIGVLSGCFDYIVSYKEKFIEDNGEQTK